jgi:hypothetical protein
MTGQIHDSVVWKKKRYALLGFDGEEDELPLFNPKDLGFNPIWVRTSCWRGYYCTYKIVRYGFFLDQLCINDGQENYPPVNGVEAGSSNDYGRVYKKILLPIPFTGVLRIGADFKSEYYVHMGFQKPSAFGIVWDLIFRDGKMTDTKDISVEVNEIEGNYHDEYRGRDLIDRIDDSFKRDLQLR